MSNTRVSNVERLQAWYSKAMLTSTGAQKKMDKALVEEICDPSVVFVQQRCPTPLTISGDAVIPFFQTMWNGTQLVITIRSSVTSEDNTTTFITATTTMTLKSGEKLHVNSVQKTSWVGEKIVRWESYADLSAVGAIILAGKLPEKESMA